MKISGGNWKKITKYLLVILVAFAAIFGLTRSKSIMTQIKKYFAAGDEPTVLKSREDNRNGTYKLSLSVTGEAEKKPSNVNVIVIVDRSGSMGDPSGTGAYVTSNYNLEDMYGYIDGQYVQLTRHGGYGNRYYTYKNAQGQDVRYDGQRYIWDSAATRLEATKAAVNGLASTLLSYNGKDGNPDDTVEMALVSFATTASTDRTPTTSVDNFLSSVNGLNAKGGTNWEAALQEANTINFGANDNDPTYVIFFSDGAPTFHSTDGGYGNWNRDYGVYGSGYEEEPNMERSYTQAVNDATSLATKVGKERFYTIFAYGETYGATYMTNLTSAAGAPSGNNYSASNSAQLQEAFAEILEKIEMAGFAEAVIEDGTTGEVKISSTDDNGLLMVDESSYKYTISFPIDDNGKVQLNGKEATVSGNKITWGDGKELVGEVKDGKFIYTWTDKNDLHDVKPQAVNNNGKVEWDLSEVGVLIDDATYTVSFDVYPSQETYDLIADIKNESDFEKRREKYNKLSDDVQTYLKPDATYENFTLKTNTQAELSYVDTRVSNEVKTKDFNELEPVKTTAETIAIKKTFENELSSDFDQNDWPAVDVNLNRDGENFIDITLNKDNTWEKKNIYISTGLAKQEGNKFIVLDEGHDYKFSELGAEAYNWELKSQTVHPMLINGTLKELILVEEGEYAPEMSGDTTYVDGYVKLSNGKIYKISDTNPTINAVNNRRSNFNLKKIVDGENANPNDEFEFTMTIIQRNEKNEVIADNKSTNDDDLWFSVQDKDGNWVDYGEKIGTWTRYVGTDRETGKTTYYYYAPNNTELTIKLKNEYNIRFTNLVSNTDFTIVEGNTTNYSLEEITTTSGFKSEKDSKEINENSKTITGHLGTSNTSYQVEYKNINDKPETISVPVKKVWEDNNDQDGIRNNETITFELYGIDQNKPVDSYTFKTTDCEGNNCNHTFTNLPKYGNGEEINYTIKETGNSSAYTPSEMTKEDNTLVITNTHTPEPTTIPVKKIWNDNNDQDGIRNKETITFELYGVNKTTPVNTYTFKTSDCTDNECTYTFKTDIVGKELPKYESGKVGVEIDYTIKEIGNTNAYTSSEMTKDGNTLVITNTHTPEPTTIPVKKVWNDNNDQDGIRNKETITFNLFGADKTTAVNSYTFKTSDCTGNECTYTFTTDSKGKELPKNSEGKEINYTITETGNTNAYTPSEMTKEGNTLVITNTHKTEVTTVPVKKVWEDNGNQDGLRGSVTFNLYGVDKDTPVNSKTFDLSSEECSNNECSYVFTTDNQNVELPKKANGQEIEYTVEEVFDSKYYESSEATKDKEGNLVITNSHTPFETEISVLKIWNDDKNRDNARKPIDVVLTAGKIPDLYNTITLNEGNDWTDGWTHLQKFMGGNPIEYTVTELTNLTGYTSDGVVKVTPDETDPYQNNVVKYEITNNRIFDKVTIPVKKVWNDNNDQDGIRNKETITFELYGTDKETPVNTYTFKTNQCANNECEYEFTTDKDGADLPKYETGKVGVEIEYTIKEVGNTNAYTPSESKEGNTLVITNTHKPEETEVPVKKVWNDNNDQDGIRNKEKITFELYGVDKDTPVNSYTFETNQCDNNECTYTFKTDKNDINLPKYSEGKEIEYTIKETGNSRAYTASEMTKEGNTLVITNTHKTDVTTIPVKKVWNDNNDQDGIRNKETITFNLFGVDKTTAVNSYTFKTSDCTNNECTYTFTTDSDGKELPKNSEGKEINYTITETGNSGEYTASEVANENGTLVITNTHKPEETEVPVKKVWNDNNDQDGIRNKEKITFELYGVDKTKAVNSYTFETNQCTNNECTYIFKTDKNDVNLPKYSEGKEIEYTIKEVGNTNAYTPSESKEGNTLVITNTHKPEETEVPVKKVWNDNNDQDGIRNKEKITFELYGVNKDIPVNSYTFETNQCDNNECTYTFKTDKNDINLPKYSEGKEIEYTIKETGNSGEYTASEVANENGTLVITNTHKPEETEVPVKKVWNDNNDQDGIRNKEKITFELYGVDKTKAVNSYTFETNQCDNNECTYTFKTDKNDINLPKYSEGKEIEYTIKETGNSRAYTASEMTKEGNTLVITNTHKTDVTTIPVKKVWNDNNDQDGIRNKETITFNLFGVDKTTAVNSYTFKTSDCTNNECTYTFTTDSDGKELPKNSEGKEINYTITETGNSREYTASEPTNENGTLVITNYHKTYTTTVPVKKVWEDNGNQDGLRGSVTFNLYGVNKDTPVNSKTFDLSSEECSNNECSYIFTTDNQNVELPKKANGQDIEYTITEEFSSDYYTSSNPTKDKEGNLVITNSHTPFETEISVLKIWNDDKNRDNARQPIEVVLTAGKIPDLYNTITLNEGNDWTDGWTHLQKFMGGKPIEYTVTEITNLTGYTSDGVVKVTPDETDPYQNNVVKYEITNNRIFDKVTIPVKKVWNDADNQDGIRNNTKVTFELYGADKETPVATHTFSDGNCTGNICEYEFTTDKDGADLPKYEHGKVGVEINYTIKETSTPDGYTSTGPTEDDPYTITNTHEPETTTVPVKKVWNDANDQDGIRDNETITFNLYGVDKDTPINTYTFETNKCANNECTYEFTTDKDGEDLPKYEPGKVKQKIEYTIEETGNSNNYTSSKSTEEDGTLVITNTHNPEPTTVPVKKVWEDANNQDGIRKNVTFELYGAAGAKVAEYTFEDKDCSGNECTYEFTKDSKGQALPKYEPGKVRQEIEYTIKETGKPDGYEASKVNKDGNTLVITNVHVPEKVNVPVTKQWVDDNNSQNTRPKYIEVQLYANGQPVDGKTATITPKTDEQGNEVWEYEFKDLEKYEAGKVKQQIDYTVKETVVPTGYTVTYEDGTIDDGTTIINTANETIKKNIPVEKVWDDLTNIEGIRPDSVTFKLVGRVGNKEVVKPYTTTIYKSEDDTNNTARSWIGEFKDVQVFFNGKLINYTLEEVTMDKSGDRYSVDIQGNDKNGYIVTNTSRPETIKFTATKNWNDNDDNDGKRPTEITVQLMNDNTGEKVGEEVVLKAEDWSYTWEDLDQFEPGKQGVKIKYSIVEVSEVEGYTPGDYDYKTNSITNNHEPITISYKVEKIWDDFDNQDGKRPKSITVRLVGKVNGEVVVPEKVQKIDSSNDWTYEFKKLPKYYKKQLIQYTITEDVVDLYETKQITQVDNTEETKELANSITNKHELIPYDNTGKITVKKIWKDRDNKFHTRPSSITIHLFADGVEIDKAILNASNNWTYTFTGLNKYKEGAVGVEVVYTITEDSVKGYNSSIDGFVVTNTMNPPTEIVPPKTGIESNTNSDNTLFYIVAIILTTLGVTTITFKYNKDLV